MMQIQIPAILVDGFRLETEVLAKVAPLMKTWKITLEYDGTKYHGWQEQNNARTVLGELRAAAGELFGEPCDMQGSGRTDAGVHAIAQVLHLRVDTHRGWKAFEIQYGLNDRLPSDIVVLDVEEAPYNFHARHDAELRSYVYQISIRKTAFAKRHVWWVKEKLDAKPMMEAAKLLAGRHNFINFAAQDPSKPGESTIVHVESASVEPDDFMLVFHITASHYLWKMVRRIVGTLVKIGHHEVTVEQFAQLLEGKPMPELPVPEWTAPSSGLFLERVTYKGDPKEKSADEDEVNREEQVAAEVDETPSHEPIPEHVLAQGKYRAPGVQPEPVNIPFVKPERKDKLPRREAVIPPAKFKPEPLITRDPNYEKPPSKRYDDGPRPVRPPFNGDRSSESGDRPRFPGGTRYDGPPTDRPPFRGGDRGGDRPPFRGDDRGGDRPPFRGGDRGGDRPPFRGGDRGGDRPPFRGGSGGGDRPPFRGGSGGGDRPLFRGGSGGGDRPPFRGGSGGGDRPPFRGGSGGGGRPGGKPFGKGGRSPKG